MVEMFQEFVRTMAEEKCSVSGYQDGLKRAEIHVKGPAPMVFTLVVGILREAAVADKNFGDPISYVRAVSETVIEELEMEEV